MTLKRLLPLLFAACLCGAGPAPIPVRAVVVAMFEVGEDTGDQPGEFQYWVEREGLTRRMPFPGGVRDLRTNGEGTVLGVVTGSGVTSATSTVMALGLDPRFDLSRAYWIIAGIAGVDPGAGSLGSAAWAEYIVDGDLCFELDAREMPSSWPYGRMASGATRPNELGRRGIRDGMVFRLNGKLADWAYRLTRDVKLMDTPAMAAERAAFTGHPRAMLAPFVFKGDSLGSSTYWHGERLNAWAGDWVKLFTAGQGTFAMTNMEDNGTATALARLDRLHKVDFQRVLVLRTASNFTMPPPGQRPGVALARESVGMLPALDAAHRVGSVVLHELLEHWGVWQGRIPGE